LRNELERRSMKFGIKGNPIVISSIFQVRCSRFKVQGFSTNWKKRLSLSLELLVWEFSFSQLQRVVSFPVSL